MLGRGVSRSLDVGAVLDIRVWGFGVRVEGLYKDYSEFIGIVQAV